jgi:hypothetical protein
MKLNSLYVSGADVADSGGKDGYEEQFEIVVAVAGASAATSVMF